jgi:hypothetical protein
MVNQQLIADKRLKIVFLVEVEMGIEDSNEGKDFLKNSLGQSSVINYLIYSGMMNK